ncbi:MAG: chromosomal replication initiator protein DnaA [Halobacteriovoraceae bacterium]|jgi:chromosomal replication initiator protein|nr:chromosomal replication initiator protein DnaA [Halobacteriovoraceae bacterium]MBT5096134.1 chromosomal replication initiator protein DnaA [Halobacteriovoraceae bacterium]
MSQEFPFDQFLSKQTLTNLPNVNENHKLDKIPAIPKSFNTAPEKPQLDQSPFNYEELEGINLEILNQLKENIAIQKFSTFFENTFTLASIEGQTIEFSVTTPFIKNMIQNHYLEQINEAIIGILGKSYSIELIITGSKKSLSSNTNNILNSINKEKTTSLSENNSQIEPQKSEKPRGAGDVKFTLDLTPTKEDLISKVESTYIDHMNPGPSGILIDPNKTFDNFIVGPSNNMAFATVISVANNPGKSGKYPSLYVYSSSGLGKTHLLHAVANRIKENYPEFAVCLITARDFMKEMIEAIQIKQLAEFQKKYSETIDVLMIDDIHELKNKQGTQNEFFHIFNELHNKGKQLIFTSDKSPKEIDGIEERVKTRLHWGLVLDIQKPDLETRIAILKRKAYELDLFLTDDVFNLIASSIKASIRELEGSLIKLSAFADVMNVEIDNDMVMELLDLKSKGEGKEITLESIARTASQYFKIPMADLKSKARGKDITKARHIAMYLSRRILRATQKDIGNFYGGRDHTSVIHGVKKITDQLKTDVNTSKDVIYIENNLS